MNRYVYEVVSTNIHNGRRDSSYFDSMKAARRWKENVEGVGNCVATICQWRVFNNKDI